MLESYHKIGSVAENNMESVENQLYDAIYLSPHLDDVAFSCSGQIVQRVDSGQRVLIVTLMAGDPPDRPLSPYAQALHDRWELDMTATACRRQEDVAACEILGADYQHWELPDCIYRRHRQTGEALYTSDEDIFAAVHLDDVALADQLAERLAGLPAAESVYVPLTVGHHVDHQLTRLAAEKWRPVESFLYYEDYPYAADRAAVARALVEPAEWAYEACTLSAAEFAQKISAMEAFVSQLSSFFTDRADLIEKIKAYGGIVGGERVWRRLVS